MRPAVEIAQTAFSRSRLTWMNAAEKFGGDFSSLATGCLSLEHPLPSLAPRNRR